MNRRAFLETAAAGATGSLPEGAAPPVVKLIELRYYRMRNGAQVQRTSAFLQKYFAPAAARAGISPLGFFSSVMAEQSPSIMVLKGYSSWEALGVSLEKLAADKDFAAASAEYNAGPELNFMRAESFLMRTFSSVEHVDLPTSGIAELRTYESANFATLKKKIEMFEKGREIEIFRKDSIVPVFFGETAIGPKMPNLTYMVSFANLAAREKAWAAFSADPDWQKLRSDAAYSDPGLVTNISNSLWSPLH